MDANEPKPQASPLPSGRCPAPCQASDRGAQWGILIGFTSWAVVLGISVAAAGRPLLGLELGAIGAAVGLGLGQLCLTSIEAETTKGDSGRGKVVALWGSLLFSMGLLLLLWTHVLAPRALADPKVRESLEGLGGATVAPDWLSLPLLGLGAALLCARR